MIVQTEKLLEEELFFIEVILGRLAYKPPLGFLPSLRCHAAEAITGTPLLTAAVLQANLGQTTTSFQHLQFE
jgi:hypothetical protein